MVFAREISDNLTSLVKKIDACNGKHKDAKMGSFVVFVGADEEVEKKLKDLAEKESLKNIVLSTMEAESGPAPYEVAKDADVTVVLYTKQEVKANYVFKKGELKEKAIDKIVADVKKILPEKDSN